MKAYSVALIPGDGIGPEILREGKKVMDAAATGKVRTPDIGGTSTCSDIGDAIAERLLRLKP